MYIYAITLTGKLNSRAFHRGLRGGARISRSDVKEQAGFGQNLHDLFSFHFGDFVLVPSDVYWLFAGISLEMIKMPMYR